MHVIFGISALVMLVGTIWMLAKDHNREWRQVAARRPRARSAGRSRPSWRRPRPIRPSQLDRSAEGTARVAAARRSTPAWSSDSSSWCRPRTTRLQEAKTSRKRRPTSASSTRRSTQLEAAENGSDEASEAREEVLDADGRLRPRGQAPRKRAADEEEVQGGRSNGRSSARAASRSAKASRRTRSTRKIRSRCRQRSSQFDADVADGEGLPHRAGSDRQADSSDRAGSAKADRRDRDRAEAAARKPRQVLDVTPANGSTALRCSTRSTPATSSSTRFGCRT